MKDFCFIADNIQKNQRSENTNSNPPCNKRSMASIIHEAMMSSKYNEYSINTNVEEVV